MIYLQLLLNKNLWEIRRQKYAQYYFRKQELNSYCISVSDIWAKILAVCRTHSADISLHYYYAETHGDAAASSDSRKDAKTSCTGKGYQKHVISLRTNHLQLISFLGLNLHLNHSIFFLTITEDHFTAWGLTLQWIVDTFIKDARCIKQCAHIRFLWSHQIPLSSAQRWCFNNKRAIPTQNDYRPKPTEDILNVL